MKLQSQEDSPRLHQNRMYLHYYDPNRILNLNELQSHRVQAHLDQRGEHRTLRPQKMAMSNVYHSKFGRQNIDDQILTASNFARPNFGRSNFG